MRKPQISEDEKKILKRQLEQDMTVYFVWMKQTKAKTYLKAYVIYDRMITNVTGSLAKLAGWSMWKDGSVAVSYLGEDAGAAFLNQAITRLYNDFDKYKEFNQVWL